MTDEKGPYELFVEKNKSPILPIMERKNSRLKNWEKFKRYAVATKEQLKFAVKYGGTLGFVTGVVMGLASYRKHKSTIVVFVSGLSTAAFVAGLMSAGTLIGFMEPIDIELEEGCQIQEFSFNHSNEGLNSFTNYPVWREREFHPHFE